MALASDRQVVVIVDRNKAWSGLQRPLPLGSPPRG